MINALKAFHRHVINVVVHAGDHRTWFRPGFIAGLLLAASGGVAQAQIKVPDMANTLKEAKTNVKSLLDWVIVIAIAAAFVIAIYGIVVGLARIFTGRGEGVGTLVVGIAATIVGIGLISVFVTGYNTATA